MNRGRPRQWPSGREYAMAQSERINRLTREIQRLLTGWRPVAYVPRKALSVAEKQTPPPAGPAEASEL